ncbi:hypothetical protein AB205_0167900, partial [Aquarana catesbeiana]
MAPPQLLSENSILPLHCRSALLINLCVFGFLFLPAVCATLRLFLLPTLACSILFLSARDPDLLACPRLSLFACDPEPWHVLCCPCLLVALTLAYSFTIPILLLPTVGVSWGTLGVVTWSQLQPSPSSSLEALVNTCWLLDSAPQGILCSNPGGIRVGVPAALPSLYPDSHPQQSAVGSTALRCTPDPNGVHLSPS